jgi:multiple sugar transport system substrate-binding protein
VGDYGATEGFEGKAAPLPRIGSQDAAWANSHQFVVMRPRSGTEDEMQASKVFIDWITRNSASWAEAGQIPRATVAREDPVFKKLEAQSALAEQVPNLRFAGGVPGISDVRESTLDQALAEAITGAMDPREALDVSARRASELLRLNREKYAAS